MQNYIIFNNWKKLFNFSQYLQVRDFITEVFSILGVIGSDSINIKKIKDIMMRFSSLLPVKYEKFYIDTVKAGDIMKSNWELES